MTETNVSILVRDVPRDLINWLDADAASNDNLRSRNAHIVWILSQYRSQVETERKAAKPRTKPQRAAA